jgi:surfactin family lipopeptide synthetase A/bacitracin synthase 1/bacitracin synthase 2/bacitracin synthase 3
MTIHESFAEQVERTPDHIALLFEDKELTYRELNKRADQLAHLLQSKGFEANTIVGLMLERSLEMIVGILAILKSGCAYLPIDPGYPEERIQYMLEDSNAKILVTTSFLAEEGEKLGRVEVRPLPPVPVTSLAYVFGFHGETQRSIGRAFFSD